MPFECFMRGFAGGLTRGYGRRRSEPGALLLRQVDVRPAALFGLLGIGLFGPLLRELDVRLIVGLRLVGFRILGILRLLRILGLLGGALLGEALRAARCGT